MKKATFLRFGAFCFSLFFASALFGQQWLVYNAANSQLPNNNVTALAIDANGNTWAGTGAGLAKFNGSSWTTYNIINSPLPVNFINVIAIDANNVKWIGTVNGGLVKFDGTNWTIYNTGNSGLPYNVVRDIAFDGSGRVWVGTSNGAARFDGSSWEVFSTFNGLPSNIVNAIEVESGGNVWFGTEPNGNFQGGVAMWDGGFFWKYSKATTFGGLPDDHIYDIEIKPSGAVWIATAGGICKFKSNNWTTYTEANSGLPEDRVLSLAFDGATLWAGTDGAGLVSFFNSTWTVFSTANSSLPHNKVQVVSVDGAGDKWLGTLQGGMAEMTSGATALDPLAESGTSFSIANPTPQSGTIRLEMENAGPVRISLLDLQGRIVRVISDEFLMAGQHQIGYQFGNLPTGLYLLRVENDRTAGSRKILLSN
jgi:sugar lactone lactonase YvrE